MNSRSLIVYGGAAAIAILSYMYVAPQGVPSAPSAEKLQPGHVPSILGDWSAAKPVCDRDEAIRAACNQIKGEYRHLSDDVIDFMVRLSQFYKHEKPSGLLGLMLVESRGDIYNVNPASSAIGGLQTLIPTLSERIIPDKTLSPTPAHARAAARLIERVKLHFPRNTAVVDEFVSAIVNYNVEQRNDRAIMATLKQMGMGVKHPDIINMKEAMKVRRGELAQLLVTKYPHVLLAVQSVDVLNRYTPEKLRTGDVYQEYVLGPTGSATLDNAIAEKARLDANAAKLNKIEVYQGPISAVDQKQMLSIINVGKRFKYSKLIIPKAPANEIFAAFHPGFKDDAPGNVSLFFTIVTERKTVPIPSKKAGGEARGKIVVTRYLIAKTLAEVKKEIHDRRTLHNANAELLDDHVKRVTASAANDIAPTTPNFVRVVEAANVTPVQN